MVTERNDGSTTAKREMQKKKLLYRQGKETEK